MNEVITCYLAKKKNKWINVYRYYTKIKQKVIFSLNIYPKKLFN